MSVSKTRTCMEVVHSKNNIIIRKEISIPIGEDVYEAIGRIYGELEGEMFDGRYLSPNSVEKGLSEAEGMKSTSTIEVHRDDPMVPVLESITRAMRRLGGLHGNVWPGFTDRSYSKQGYDWYPRIYTSSKFPEHIAGKIRTFRFTGYNMFDSLKKYKHGVNITVEDIGYPGYEPELDTRSSKESTTEEMDYEDSESD